MGFRMRDIAEAYGHSLRTSYRYIAREFQLAPVHRGMARTLAPSDVVRLLERDAIRYTRKAQALFGLVARIKDEAKAK